MDPTLGGEFIPSIVQVSNPGGRAMITAIKSCNKHKQRKTNMSKIVPYADSAPLSAKLLKNSTLKTYKGFPHGMPTTEADTINADLLAFIKS